MVRVRTVTVLLALAAGAAPAWADAAVPQGPFATQTQTRASEPEQSFSSQSAATCLRDIGYEAAYSPDTTGAKADQAIILLMAAKSLDGGVAPVEPLLLKLLGRHPQGDYSSHLVAWLQAYVDPSCDRVVVRDAIQSTLDRLGSVEDRKKLLEELAVKLAGKNAAVDSELATQLGFLMGQKGDVDTARFYLIRAYMSNEYNKIAFAKLAQIAPGDIGPGVYLEHLRLVLRENPLNLDAALNFAQYAQQLQLYDLAALSYEYGAELYRYLYPAELLPARIYLPWAISSYNTKRGQPVTIQIAKNVRGMGCFDLVLEAFAARAAAATGSVQEAGQISRQAEQKAEQLLQSGSPQAPTPTQLAWFYCFGDPNARAALAWANKAYSAEPNSPPTRALLAYALSLNGQMDPANSLAASSAGNQIAGLVQAKTQIEAGNKQQAVQTLNAAINEDASSLAAEQAKEMLAELQSPYVPPVNVDALMGFLAHRLGQAVTPQFLPPDKMIQVQFNVHGKDFSFGSEIDGIVTVTNQGPEPLVITDDSLFKGAIRVDARVSGSLQRQISPLVSQTVRTALEVPPGKSYTVPVRLSTGELRDVLETYPQASLEIEFVLYVDPVTAKDGSVSNWLLDLKPVTATVNRPGVELTASYVRNRFNAISTGQQGQRIATAELFTSLLKEQQAMAEHGTLYPYRSASWMPGLLRSALTSDAGLLLASGDDDWVVAVHAMADMLSLPLDEGLVTAVAKDLNRPEWPVRMMALYLLASEPHGDFQPVLDWFAQNDANQLVRALAMTSKPGLSAAARAGPTP
jgi:hypothetical protein